MSNRLISGQTDVPGIGTVRWTAKELTAWGGDVVRVTPVSADGPNGPLSSEEMDQLRAAESRLR